MDSELRELEEELSRLAPEALPDGLIARMEAAMDGWQEAEEEEKVVPFPQQEKKSRAGLWRTAAAVAILGASAALLVPSGKSTPKAVALSSSMPFSTPASDKVSPVFFEPMSAQRNMVSANNQGMVVMQDEMPFRCVRVQYLDRFEFEGESGETLRVSKPAVKYILIPVRPD